jgi:hypothetical protein
MTEAQLHTQIVNWLRLALPEGAVLHHSPAGIGKLGWKGKNMMRTHGVLAGFPDLFILYRSKAIFIELKSKTGRVSAVQKICMNRLTLAGGVCHVCKSLGEVELFLEQLMPLRAKVL